MFMTRAIYIAYHKRHNGLVLTFLCSPTDCPQCYNLVQDAVNTHRGKLRELSAFIDQTEENPSLFNDTSFVNKLNEVQGEVDELLREARGASSESQVLCDFSPLDLKKLESAVICSFLYEM